MNDWRILWNQVEPYIPLAITLLITILAFSYLIKILKWYQQSNREAKKRVVQRLEIQRQKQIDAERERAIEQSVAALRASAEKTAARRVAIEKATEERIKAEREAADRAIREWILAEEAEARRLAARRSSLEQTDKEELDAKHKAAEQAIAEWVAAMQAGVESGQARHAPIRRDPLTKPHNKVDDIKRQVFAMLEQIKKELEDLDFILNKIQTGVDFLPIQVQDTISKWKRGEIHRRSTLDDLKLKFRFMAYSVEDGWELYHLYSDWIIKQRERLLVFINLLGTEPKQGEAIISLIERAEKAEWEKHLDMDMDVIFTLKKMRDILQSTHYMETCLEKLEALCRKRADQIIAPSWDPKGIL